jgi:hypothetical protein
MYTGKYIFQEGGDADQTGSIFFNSLADQFINQQQAQQDGQQYTQPADQPTEDEDSEFIKGLKEYDADQKSNALTDRLDELERRLNNRLDELSMQQQQQEWLSSDDGFNYLQGMYDTQIEDKTPLLENAALQQRQLMAESGGYDNAVSPKGAMGAYQFMPSTWEEYKPSPNASPFNRADAEYAYNKYMGALLNQFGNDQRKATAAYNAGPTRVQRLIDKYGDDWEKYLPEETKGYLNKIFTIPSNIKTKPGVDIQNVNKNLLSMVSNFDSVYPGLVISSGTDSKHMKNSAHYDGEAIDIGANSSNKQAYQKFKQSLPELQRKYGIKFLDEGDHIHVSLSSKGKT